MTGGVVSGLGKGITAASLGRLLKAKGYKVISQKLDPYINVDPGTMSPYQHGEVFVTEDGAETDLDLGHYERFIDENLNKYSNLTSGKVYWNVLNKERHGDYLGETIQVIPHITNEIKNFVHSVGEKSGSRYRHHRNRRNHRRYRKPAVSGGDSSALPGSGKRNCLFIHVTFIPYIVGSGEYKSKPTQHSVKELRSLGIFPNIIVARCDQPIPDSIRQKISMFCNVREDCVINNTNVPVLYEAPQMLEESNFSEIVCRELALENIAGDMSEWEAMTERIRNSDKEVKIALVGKYVQLHDAYLSVAEALRHGGWENGANVNIEWIDSEGVNSDTVRSFWAAATDFWFRGGFGDRGIERRSRRSAMPGNTICRFGNLSRYADGSSGIRQKRTGAQERKFQRNSLRKARPCYPLDADQRRYSDGRNYETGRISLRSDAGYEAGGSLQSGRSGERHRHRYEFNNSYREKFTEAGMVFSGLSPDGRLVEAVELPDKKFFVGVQYHPEFKSRPTHAHPLFRELIRAALEK